MDANLDAVQRAMQAWTGVMQESDWRRSQAGLEADAGADAVGRVQLLAESTFGHVRDTNELAEEVLSRLQAAQAQPTPSTAAEEGHDDGRHVTVQLASGGLTACTIEPDWAKHHNGDAISAGLSAALRCAVAKRSVSSPRVEPDDLLGDALATLTSLTQICPDQGGN